MATLGNNIVATIKKNVVRISNKKPVLGKNPKKPIEYKLGFDGTEELQWQAQAFQAVGKIARTDSAQLSTDICIHFKETFHDLRGCNVICTNGGHIQLEMYFEKNTEPLPDGKIVNLESLIEPVGVGANNNLLYKKNVVNNKFSGKFYTLNNETRLLLSKFMYGGADVNAPDNTKIWGNQEYVKEVHAVEKVNSYPYMNNVQTTERVFLYVTGFDMNRIIQEVYGDDIVIKTVAEEDGEDTNYRSKARYKLEFHNYLDQAGKFAINIYQFDYNEVQKIYTRENPIPQQYFGGIRMYG